MYLSRTVMLAAGTLTFSLACLLMGLSSEYWHLVILRMLIAMGLAVCRYFSVKLLYTLHSYLSFICYLCVLFLFISLLMQTSEWVPHSRDLHRVTQRSSKRDLQLGRLLWIRTGICVW